MIRMPRKRVLISAVVAIAFAATPVIRLQAKSLEAVSRVKSEPVHLLGKCKTIFADPEFDCSCVTHFLDTRLPNKESDIVLTVWALSIDRTRDHSGDVDSLYLKYGVLRIDAVLYRFNRMRMDLFMNCPAAEPEEDDDPF